MDFTTEQLMDAVKSDFLKLKKRNELLERVNDKLQGVNDELSDLSDKHDELIKRNKSLKAYINHLEEDNLQLRLQNSFYESMFKEEVEQKPETKKQKHKKVPCSIDSSNETKDAPQQQKTTPKPHPLEQKMKKSVGPVKNYSSREPEYHMSKVARDWAS